LHWIPLAILVEFCFGQVFKWAERRGGHMPMLVSTNYLVMAIVLALYFWFTDNLDLSADVVKVGLVIGCAFITSMTVLTTALKLVHVGSVLTALRLSMVLPVVVSVLIWNESVIPGQIVGIALALIALFFMTHGSNHAHKLSGPKAMAMIAAVFLCQGISMSCLRWVHFAGLDDQHLKVLLVTSATAGLLGLIVIAVHGQRPKLADLIGGSGIGLYNLLALSVILFTLSQVPGTVFFPLLGCTVVILDNLCAHFFWKESLSRLAAAGVALGLVAILLVV
jgi:drug/metabolite transporter (DMT)-like permease